RLAIALAGAQDVAQRVERLQVRRAFRRQTVEDLLLLVDLFQRIEIERLPDVDSRLQRRAGRNAVISVDRILVALRRLVGAGERGEREGVIGLGVERELQIED